MINRFLSFFLFCFFPHFLALAIVSDQQAYQYLDSIALRTNADKASNYHNYTEVYACYFAPLKDQAIKFLEIGIFHGASVRLWEEYFPYAQLHFIDITLGALEYYSNRSTYHICNQENVADLQRFIQNTGGEFDIIIDDGGHTMNQQITSFVTLFPYLKSGGLYIVEDLHTSYWPSFYDRGAQTMISFLKGLIDEVNYVGAHTSKASHLGLPPSLLSQMNLYQETILSIHFYDSLAIVIKR
jgi:hypothetical protein